MWMKASVVVYLQVAKHMKAYMQVAHALLAWHIGLRRHASKASHGHGTRSEHSQHHGTRTKHMLGHGDSSGHSHNYGRKSGQSAVQRLPDEQQQILSSERDALNMQPVTDKCSITDHAEDISQMQQSDASSQSATDQQSWVLPGALTQQVHTDQPSQHDHMGQLSQQNVENQMSHILAPAHLDQQQHNSSAQLQNQFQHLHDCSDEEDQVQLSYSQAADLSCELDLQSSAVSQLMGTTAVARQIFNLRSDAGPPQISGCPRVFEAPEQAVDESQASLAVRTEKGQRLHVRSACTMVPQEMAESPSAAHGRRKQPRLESARCLKF